MKTWNVPSAPCWADLSAADPRAAAAFYERLFGWELGGVPGLDGYRAFLSEGEPVGGLGPRRPGRRPSVWRPYFVAGPDGAGESPAERVALARGKVLGEPVEVPGVCRATLCADSSGAVFGLWEPDGHQGFGRVNAPGSPPGSTWPPPTRTVRGASTPRSSAGRPAGRRRARASRTPSGVSAGSRSAA